MIYEIFPELLAFYDGGIFMNSSLICSLVLLISSFFNQAFSHDLEGEKVLIGRGYARSFVHLNAKLEPSSIGVILSREALDALPKVDQNYSLKLPIQIAVAPYKEIVINWNAQGHEPTDIYGIPHFDFHFYGISKEQRNSIMCSGGDVEICTREPTDDYIPAYYIPTPAGVPMMGWHWLDSRSPELNGKRFTSTFIYGYYNGELIFSEPMITREFLLSNGSVNRVLPTPLKYAINGYYPKKYILNYDASKKVYRVVLKDLVLRDSGK